MRILIYDLDCCSSGTKYPIKSAFEILGHQADMFDWGYYFFKQSKIIGIDRIKNILFKNVLIAKINNSLIDIIKNGSYDLFLVSRGDFILPETLVYAKKNIKHLVNWNTDDIFNKITSSNVNLETFQLYDIHFSPRENLKDEYLAKGAKSFEVLHWYYRFGLNYEQNRLPNFSYSHNTSFIGAWSTRRQDILSVLSDESMSIYGWGWGKKIKESVENWSINNNISIIEMNRIFQYSKININILTIENRDVNNLRNFEIPAAGGFQLSERSDSILNLFKEDNEIVCFSSKEELLSKYKFYLKNENLREKIAAAGQKKVFNTKNSLIDRLLQIINKIQKDEY